MVAETVALMAVEKVVSLVDMRVVMLVGLKAQ